MNIIVSMDFIRKFGNTLNLNMKILSKQGDTLQKIIWNLIQLESCQLTWDSTNIEKLARNILCLQ